VPKQISNVATDDYLTTIYRLDHDEGQPVIAVRLADRLGITPPSVAGMLKRLDRRHRLAECLLTSVLGVEWWRAYEEAHLLEHGISDITESRLYEALERPTRSPFGYPIPIPGASPPTKLSMTTLAAVPEGETVEIDRVFEEDEQLLQFFDAEGIRPGRLARMERVEPYRGTLTVAVGERAVVVGTQVASRIWVRAAGVGDRPAASRPGARR
jgi:DtxR family Mn-dependent transcriptional regulator